jgi:hypothetical protein
MSRCTTPVAQQAGSTVRRRRRRGGGAAAIGDVGRDALRFEGTSRPGEFKFKFMSKVVVATSHLTPDSRRNDRAHELGLRLRTAQQQQRGPRLHGPLPLNKYRNITLPLNKYRLQLVLVGHEH